jgi:hypothetical protein
VNDRTKSKSGRPTRFPGKSRQQRLTVSITPACRERIHEMSVRMSCSLSDAVEYSVWQVNRRLQTATAAASTGGQHEQG